MSWYIWTISRFRTINFPLQSPDFNRITKDLQLENWAVGHISAQVLKIAHSCLIKSQFILVSASNFQHLCSNICFLLTSMSCGNGVEILALRMGVI